MLLLDTCALLWLSSGDKRLKTEILNKINISPTVYISAITGFEISLKYQKGKLELPVSPDKWFDIVLKHHDISVIPLDLNICITANDLPAFHKDPCDRFIIATARIMNLPIVTADEKFEVYGVDVIF